MREQGFNSLRRSLLCSPLLLASACRERERVPDLVRRKYGGSASLIGWRWGIPASEPYNVAWLPLDFQGGEVVANMLDGGLIGIEIQSLVIDDSTQAESPKGIAAYERAKAALTLILGAPHVTDEHRYYIHKNLYDCLSLPKSYDIAPSCAWEARWSKENSPSVYLGLTESRTVLISQSAYYSFEKKEVVKKVRFAVTL